MPRYRGRGLTLRILATLLGISLDREYIISDQLVGPLRCAPNNPGPARDAFYGVRTDRLTFDLAVRFLQRGALVIDVGANFGYTVRMFAAAVGPSGVVHAFEPNPPVYDQLLENARLAPEGNIETHCIALGDRRGTVPLSLPSRGNIGMVTVTGEGRPLGSIALVKLLDDFDFTPTLLKIDAENWDGHVLAGGHETLKRMAVTRSLVIAEAHLSRRDEHVAKLLSEVAWLQRAGFVAWLATEREIRPWDGQLWDGNFVLTSNWQLQ